MAAERVPDSPTHLLKGGCSLTSFHSQSPENLERKLSNLFCDFKIQHFFGAINLKFFILAID